MTTGPLISYLGWHGRGNLGDDAMYDAVRAQLPGATFLDHPHLPRERLRAVVTGSDRRARRSHLVIGGGTCVGRSNWRAIVTRATKTTGTRQRYAIGIGVEDPVFGGYRSHSDDGEINRWVPILKDFDTVSVRGPRSAELLADAGFDVAISGDPALVLPLPDVEPEDGLIGVNLGFGDDLWGHDPDALVERTSAALRELSKSGHRVVGILLNPDDERWTRAALDGISTEVVLPADAVGVADVLAKCSVAIVTRLHAAILASLSGTPVVALEYQPKCRDFARSIDDEASLIRTDKLTAATLLDQVNAALAESATIRARKRAAVSVLRQRLLAEYAEARSRLEVAV